MSSYNHFGGTMAVIKSTMNLKKLIQRIDLEFIMWFLSSSSVNNLLWLSKLSSLETYYGNIWNVLEHSLVFMKIIVHLKRKELWKFHCCHSFWTWQILLDFHAIVCVIKLYFAIVSNSLRNPHLRSVIIEGTKCSRMSAPSTESFWFKLDWSLE